ncbi:hypothetical protein SAMD00019534_116680 [Acytostelium subglobosum LB1]|uniref:hypothetical protein n=1 Tax=Acytostelium subglobosum LB1 TaxID=1410327 RepID=UPI000644F932|nr:hypothetical protein SAMD00019534_116680 [Acytostelium subglobosum LB1]GAM28492.1 hypothetical protein SAMD00019534_116680 [Acytostelium subglobosum LB1]|eukprot:XP_012748531.1 hypothetical protein SAMD00019534_116680 [Acytostelium subglobosum LB1]
MTALQKKALLRRQLEESLKDYEEPIKYFRSILLWHRPVDLGVLIVLLTTALWYLRGISLSVVTTVFLAIPTYLLIQLIAQNANLNIISKVFPHSSSHEAFIEVVNTLVSIRFSMSEMVIDLYRFKQLSPVKFFAQTTLVCLLIAYIGTLFSGYSLFILTLYTVLLLPGFISNQHHSSIVSTVLPLIESSVQAITATITSLVDQYINKQPAGANVASNSNSNNAPRPSPSSNAYPDTVDITKKNS